MMKHLSYAVFTAILLFSCSKLQAQQRVFSYQAAIKTSSGAALADGVYSITIRLYDVEAGGSHLYSEQHEVAVANGILNLEVGSKDPFPPTFTFDRDLFLGLTIGTEPELQPRTKVLSAPVAIFAAQAGEAQRLSPNATGVVKSLNELSGSVRLAGDSTISIKQVGNVLLLHVDGQPTTGIQTLTSPENTLQIQSPSGPTASLDIANAAVTTQKLADGAVTGSKIAQLGAQPGQALKWNGTIWAPANDMGLLTVVANPPLSGDGTPGNPLLISQAGVNTNGFLSSTDWVTFNSKLSSVAVTPRLQGDGTAGSPLDLAQQGASVGQALKWNGTSWSPAADLVGMTAVMTDATLAGDGTTGNALKIAQQGAGNGQLLKWNGTTWLPANDLTGLTSVTVNAPLSGTGTAADPIALAQATASTNGYLSSADWTTFNNKLSSVAVTPRLTGNGTTANPLDLAQQGATNGQVLKWNGTTWTPGDDATGLTTVSVRAPELGGNGTTTNPIALLQQGASSGQVLKWNGTSWSPAADNGLTSVAVTARLTGNGTSASPLDIAQQGATSGQVLKWNGSTWVPGNDLTGLQVVSTDATLDGDGTPADVLKIAQQGATSGQVLKWNGTTWLPANDLGLQTVSVRSPELAGSGTTLDPIYLSQQGAANGQVLKWNGTSWSPAADAGLLTVAVNAPITGNGTTASPISIAQANGSTNGYLSSTDWMTFNNKLSTVAVTPRLSGNGTAANPLDIAQQGATNGQVLKWNGTSWSPGNDAGAVITDATLDGDGTAADVLKIAQQGATSGQVLKWNGSTWLPADDNGLTSVSVTSRLTGNGTVANPLDIAQQGATTGQVLRWNGTSWTPGPGGLSSVAVNAPITGDGTIGNPISIAQANGTTNGYLSSTDWTTFNNKLSSVAVTPRLTGNGTAANPLDIAQQGATTGQVLRWNGSTWSPGAGGLSNVAVNAPITGDGTTGNPISIAQANGTTNGYLSSTDWTTFTNKLSAVAVTARLTGNGTSASPLDIAQQGATNGQVLKWNGSSWAPADDLSSSIANGTVTNSTLRWSGSSWVENTNVLSTAAGLVTVNAGLNLNGSTSPLQVNGSAGTNGYVLVSQGSGNTPTWQDANSLVSAWRLNGNTLTGGSASAPTEFFGSTNNYDVIFRTNNTERMRIVSGGNVGIGITTPTEARFTTSASILSGGVQRLGSLFTTTFPSGISDGAVPYNGVETRFNLQNSATINLVGASMVALTTLQGTNTNTARGSISVVDISTTAPATHALLEGVMGRVWVNPSTSGTVTVTNAMGLRSDLWLQANSVTVQNGFGVYVDNPNIPTGISANVITNFTGLYVENITNGTGTRRVMHYAGSGSNLPFVLTDLGRVGIGHTTPAELLDVRGNARLTSNGSTAPQLQLQNPAGTFHSSFTSGSQTATINYTLPNAQPSTNQVLTATNITGAGPYNVTLGWQSSSGSAWNLTGNSGTTAGTNFLGTTDNQPFEIRIYSSDPTANQGSKRVMRYEPNATSPNILGGFQGNVITSGVHGAIIASGGYNGEINRATEDFSIVVGGANNQAGDNTGTTSDGAGAIVVGGSDNRALRSHSFVGGGSENITGPSGIASSIVGGEQNYAAEAYSFVGGGTRDTTLRQGGVIGGGSTNSTLYYSAIPGGEFLRLGSFSFGFNQANNGNTAKKADVSNYDSIAYFGNVDLWLGNTGPGRTRQLRFYQLNSGVTYPASVYYTAFQAPSSFTSGSITYTLPSAAAAQNGGLMASTTGGAMSWTQNLAWDATNSRLAVNTNAANTKLDVNGDLALRENSVSLANGNNNNVNVGNYSFIRITGPTGAFTITGIAGGQNGRTLVLYNDSGQSMTINHLDNTNSNNGNLIRTRNGAAYSTPGGSSYDVVTMIYSAAGSQWIITSVY